MKKIIFVLLVILVLCGCEFPNDIEIYIDINIDGSDFAFIIINGYDYGLEKLPFNLSYHYDESHFLNRNITVTCYAPENITLEVYENNVLEYTDTNTFIDYSRY